MDELLRLDDILKLIGLFVSLSVLGWGVARWLLGRIDAINTHFTKEITATHQRINDVKDKYVKRSELDRDFNAMEKRLEGVEKSIADSRAETNARLDRMLMLLGKLITKDSSHDD